MAEYPLWTSFGILYCVLACFAVYFNLFQVKTNIFCLEIFVKKFHLEGYVKILLKKTYLNYCVKQLRQKEDLFFFYL